jgi:hypothetical protein
MVAHYALGWVSRGSYIWGAPHAVAPVIDRASQPIGFWSGVFIAFAVAGTVFAFGVFNLVRHLRRRSGAM